MVDHERIETAELATNAKDSSCLRRVRLRLGQVLSQVEVECRLGDRIVPDAATFDGVTQPNNLRLPRRRRVSKKRRTRRQQQLVTVIVTVSI